MSTTGPLFETCRGVVLPTMCDHLGHMNARWYAWHFDDASFHVWTLAGLSHKEMRERGMYVVTAQVLIKYVHELKVGELFVVRSGFTRLGTKSVTHLASLYNADTQELAATQETVDVCFDPATRKAVALPEDLRQRLNAKLMREAS